MFPSTVLWLQLTSHVENIIFLEIPTHDNILIDIIGMHCDHSIRCEKNATERIHIHHHLVKLYHWYGSLSQCRIVKDNCTPV